jgi:hypothetical protein
MRLHCSLPGASLASVRSFFLGDRCWRPKAGRRRGMRRFNYNCLQKSPTSCTRCHAASDVRVRGRPWLRPPFRRPGSSARTAVLLCRRTHGCPRRRSQLLLPCLYASCGPHELQPHRPVVRTREQADTPPGFHKVRSQSCASPRDYSSDRASVSGCLANACSLVIVGMYLPAGRTTCAPISLSGTPVALLIRA